MCRCTGGIYKPLIRNGAFGAVQVKGNDSIRVGNRAVVFFPYAAVVNTAADDTLVLNLSVELGVFIGACVFNPAN